jgi:hypothetical protein
MFFLYFMQYCRLLRLRPPHLSVGVLIVLWSQENPESRPSAAELCGLIKAFKSDSRMERQIAQAFNAVTFNSKRFEQANTQSCANSSPNDHLEHVFAGNWWLTGRWLRCTLVVAIRPDVETKILRFDRPGGDV